MKKTKKNGPKKKGRKIMGPKKIKKIFHQNEKDSALYMMYR